MIQNCSELPTTVEARPLNRPHQASKPAPPHSAKVKVTNVTIYADRKDVTKATDGGGEGSTGNASIQYIYIYILDARREGLKALNTTLRRFDASTLRCFANGAAEDVSTLRRFAKGGLKPPPFLARRFDVSTLRRFDASQ